MTEQSKTFEAKENTEGILKKMVVFEDNMTDELNTLAKQALFSAKMEVFMAELENIAPEQLSGLAQRVYENPNLALTKEFTLKELTENFGTTNGTQKTMDDFGGAEIKKDDVEVEIVEVETKSKTPKKRREWSIRQIVDLGECEMKIEILRPRLRNPKEPVGDEIQVRL